LRSLPLDHRHIHGVLWRIHGVIVERLVVGRELSITEKSIVLFADFNDTHNFVLNWIFFWFFFFLHVLLVLHHFMAVLCHLLSVFILLLVSEHLLVLLLSQLHAIRSNKLGGVILPHHLLLLVKNERGK